MSMNKMKHFQSLTNLMFLLQPRNLTSFEVLYKAKSSRATVDEDILEVTYLINIQIAEGMIVNTTYLYTEIEKR